MLKKYEEVELSKKLVLEKFSQETIFATYGIPVTNKLIRNPLRDDKNPSCSFYESKGTIYFVDKAADIHYDCFNLVQHIYKVGFYEALRIIYHGVKEANIIRTPRVKLENTRTEIYVEPIPYTKELLEYFNYYGIRRSTLITYKVYSVGEVILNRKNRIYKYNKDLAICYKYDVGVYKIYFPYMEKRFINNCGGYVEGINQLPEKGDLLIITKSLKDVMCLYELGYNAISPNSESSFITDKLFNSLKERFTRIVLFFDNDETGKMYSQKITEKYKIESIFIPSYMEIKDLSDFIYDYDIESAKELMNQLLNN